MGRRVDAPQGSSLGGLVDYSERVEGGYSEGEEDMGAPGERVPGEGVYMCLGDVAQQHAGESLGQRAPKGSS